MPSYYPQRSPQNSFTVSTEKSLGLGATVDVQGPPPSVGAHFTLTWNKTVRVEEKVPSWTVGASHSLYACHRLMKSRLTRRRTELYQVEVDCKYRQLSKSVTGHQRQCILDDYSETFKTRRCPTGRLLKSSLRLPSQGTLDITL